MNVSGLVLHPTVGQQLDVLISAPPHALLLSGPTGTGKSQVAHALARNLLEHHEVSLVNQPYFRLIQPEKNSISIEQIRSLISFFRLTVPGNAAIKRVAIIEDADTMGREAQNALLKLLEEPPAGSVLILTSSRPQSLLPTIRSRTTLQTLASPPRAALQQHFEAAGYDSATVSAALLRASTNIAEAARLLTEGSDTPDAAVALVKQALGGNSYERMLLVDGLSKQKDKATEFVDTLAAIAMASLEAAAAKRAASVDRWKDVLQAAHTAQDAFEHSGNTKLVLTELMLAL